MLTDAPTLGRATPIKPTLGDSILATENQNLRKQLADAESRIRRLQKMLATPTDDRMPTDRWIRADRTASVVCDMLGIRIATLLSRPGGFRIMAARRVVAWLMDSTGLFTQAEIAHAIRGQHGKHSSVLYMRQAANKHMANRPTEAKALTDEMLAICAGARPNPETWQTHGRRILDEITADVRAKLRRDGYTAAMRATA